MVPEYEHSEILKKPFSEWIEDTCRLCQHKRLFHIGNLGAVLKDGVSYLHASCNFITREGICNCPEWQSPDNLDYIELLAKRRGLIPDEKDET